MSLCGLLQVLVPRVGGKDGSNDQALFAVEALNMFIARGHDNVVRVFGICAEPLAMVRPIDSCTVRRTR